MQPLLASLRILELGHFIAAPFATRLLADLGADVIKVEPPGEGDPVRGWGQMVDGRSLWWSVHGRNKRCITANLRSPEGRALILDLVRHVDIVVENYRPGQLERYGLGPDALSRAKPGLVLVRISGYGQTGPEASRSGFGVIGEAKGGLRYLCAHPGSTLPPVRTGISIGDSIAGLYGALGAVSAVLAGRERVHAGAPAEGCQVIDVALGEAVLSLLEGCLPEYGKLGEVRQPAGSRLSTAAPSNAYRTADGAFVLIAGNSEPLFAALTELMGRPDLARDPRFADNPSRVANVDELDALIGAWTAGLDAAALLDMLEARNIPASKIFTIADIAADAQYQAREMVVAVDDPHHGPLLHPGVMPVVSGVARTAQIRWAGPDVGQHNDDVYGALLGLGGERLEELRARGAI